jgi:hypothetical protein
MRIQQAEGGSLREKSMGMRRQVRTRIVASVPRRNHLVFSILGVLLTGVLLLSTAAFGQTEDIDCSALYKAYGWLPNQACHELLK